MRFVKEQFFQEIEIKKSKFIAHIFPYNDFEKTLKKLKIKHPKGRHFVYAYRYLNQFEQIVENSSDDGEPKGTSGKPSLAVLAGAEVINTGVIIIRYFGGIKLGTGGLVRAYADAVNEVMKTAQWFEYQKLIQKKLTFEYNQLSKVEYLLNRYSVKILQKIFDKRVIFFVEVSQEQNGFLEEELERECNFEEVNN